LDVKGFALYTDSVRRGSITHTLSGHIHLLCLASGERSHSPAVSGMHREGDYPPAVLDRGTGVTIYSQGVQYLDLFRYNRTLEALHFWAPPTLGWDFDWFIKSDAALLAFMRTLEECPRSHCLTLYFHQVMTPKF